jgi:glycerol-3-phosphate dehydrogenase (NAD(P)+)
VTRAAVLGTGAWGTTFAGVLADAGNDVILWGNDDAANAEINESHTNAAFSGERILPETVRATGDAEEAFAGADLVFLALPAQKARAIVADYAALVPRGAVVASLMKGIEVGSHLRMSEVLAEVWGIENDRLAVVSGPNLASEIALQQPTATVVASTSAESAKRVADAIASSYFRPYTNPDVVGVELCGAYKNVIAVSVGIADGRGFGNNTTATIITRGLAEIARLGLALGASAETFPGLAGMGDLIATCASPLSRNHTLGSHIGQGYALRDAIAETKGTAEGVETSRSIQQLADELGVEVPICDAVVKMLHGGADPETIMSALLSRPRKAEGE